MMRHRRAPAVKHRCDADPGATPLGIVGLQPTGLSRGGDRRRGLSRRREQQILDRGFVLVGDIGDRYAGPISGLLSNPLDFNP